MVEAWKLYAIATIIIFMFYLWFEHTVNSPNTSVYPLMVLSLCLFTLWCAVVVA